MAEKVFNRGVRAAGRGSGFHVDAREAGTDASQAVTIHNIFGRITSSTAALGAVTTEEITLTNRYIRSNSMVVCTVSGGGSGEMVLAQITPSNGSCVITVRNVHASQAATAVYTIDFMVFNPLSAN